MTDAHPTSFTSQDLADRLGGTLRGSGDVAITSVNALDAAGPKDVTFVHDEAHARRLVDSDAGAAVVGKNIATDLTGEIDRPLIIVDNAELASITLLELFAPSPPLPAPGVHPTAFVDPSVSLGKNARIGPHVSIDADCVIGNNVVLHAGVRLYPKVEIGDNCVLHANCVVSERCVLKNRVVLHQNVSIGADGFGYRPNADGSGLSKVPHLGNVVLEDDVEIGANSCVDRAKFGTTLIDTGAKIDNLVQIGHNCRVGKFAVIAALTGIGGSTTIGDGVQIAGHVGIADHKKIGRGARIGGHSGVAKNIPDGETWFGSPLAFPINETLRQVASLRKLPGLIDRLSGQSSDESP